MFTNDINHYLSYTKKVTNSTFQDEKFIIHNFFFHKSTVTFCKQCCGAGAELFWLEPKYRLRLFFFCFGEEEEEGRGVSRLRKRWRRQKKKVQRRRMPHVCLALSLLPHHSERPALRLGVAAEKRHAHRVPLGPGGPGDAARD